MFNQVDWKVNAWGSEDISPEMPALQTQKRRCKIELPEKFIEVGFEYR
jgi:hypothetical protein